MPPISNIIVKTVFSIFSSSLCFSLQFTHKMVTKFSKWLDFWRLSKMTIRFIKIDTITNTNDVHLSSLQLIFTAYLFSVAFFQRLSSSLIFLIKWNAARGLLLFYIRHPIGNENVICKLMTSPLSKYKLPFPTNYLFPSITCTYKRY